VDEFAQVMDVQSFSHQFENVPAFHAIAPWKAVGLGESGSCQADRGEYAGNRSAGHIGFGGVLDCVGENLDALAIPYSYGMFSWTFTDYLGETAGPWPDVSSSFGVYDLAGFPKDSALLFSAWWRGDCSSVALSPSDWTSPVAVGAPIDVAALTCAPQAELFLNGASLGVLAVPPRRAAVWPRVAFAPGNLTVLARDAAGGALGSATVLSAGAPYALRAWVESPYQPPRNGSVIAADGADVALIGVEVLDAAGVVCPAGAVNISFTVAGPGAVYGVANGDPADHGPPKAAWRLSFHGRARAIINSAAPGAVGTIEVTASALGLLPATVALSAE
jgi:beta-galactosidase